GPPDQGPRAQAAGGAGAAEGVDRRRRTAAARDGAADGARGLSAVADAGRCAGGTVIPRLDDDQHERLWRICDALVSGAGARAAIVCDAANGSVIVSVGDTTAAGAATGVQLLGPGERVVHGASGQIYGVEI